MQKHTWRCSSFDVALPSQHAGKGRQAPEENLQSRHKNSIGASVCGGKVDCLGVGWRRKTQLRRRSHCGWGNVVFEKKVLFQSWGETLFVSHPGRVIRKRSLVCCSGGGVGSDVSARHQSFCLRSHSRERERAKALPCLPSAHTS